MRIGNAILVATFVAGFAVTEAVMIDNPDAVRPIRERALAHVYGRHGWVREPATNRMRKVLRFFNKVWERKGMPGQEIPPGMTRGVAGRIIRFFKEEDPELWNLFGKYVHLTDDHRPEDGDDETDELRDFDWAELEACEVPPEEKKKRHRAFDEAFLAAVNADIVKWGFLNDPPPEVVFSGREFVLTGKFEHGKKQEIAERIKKNGGKCAAGLSQAADYLVVGGEGNPSWKHGKYGEKIERAAALQKKHGSPDIISEARLWEFLA